MRAEIAAAREVGCPKCNRPAGWPCRTNKVAVRPHRERLRLAESRERPPRVAIIFDGSAWHVRRIRVIEHDLDRDEKVYRCDVPIVNDLRDGGYGALEVARRYISSAHKD